MRSSWVRSDSGAPAISINLSNDIKSLDKESDPELRGEGRLRLASRLEAKHPEMAAQIYAELAQDSSSFDFSRQAQARLQGLVGQGDFGQRAEILLRQSSQELLSPRLLLPMMAGSIAFSLSRGLVGARLAASGSWWGSAWRGRTLSAAAGFGVEVPTFVALQNLGQGNLLSTEGLAHGALSLGALKLSHAALALPFGRLPSNAALTTLMGIGSLFAVNRLEQKVGWRPVTEASSSLAESVVTYFSLAAGMRAGRSLLGPGFQRLETRLAWLSQGEGLGRPGFVLQPNAQQPALATLGSGGNFHNAPLMMTGSQGEPLPPSKSTRQNWSIPPTTAKKLSLDHQADFMNPRRDPPLRWKALENYRQIHPQLADTQAFPQAQKVLLRLVAQPGLSSKVLKGRSPTESVAFHGYQHLLRRTAAELYVQALERSNFAEPLVERGAQIFRKVLEQPHIAKSYRPDPRHTEGLDYYRKAEAECRQRLFPLYTQLLFRLPAGSREVVKGIEMLSRAQWLHQFIKNSETSSSFPSAALVGRAYAYLLDASTPAQRAATRKTREHMLQWILPLESEARGGNREALRALTMAARYEKPAAMALSGLERGGTESLRKETEDFKLALRHRELRRADDLKRRPEASEKERVLRWLAYYFREWFWFLH